MYFVNSCILSGLSFVMHIQCVPVLVHVCLTERPDPSLFTSYTNDILRKAQQKFPQTLSVLDLYMRDLNIVWVVRAAGRWRVMATLVDSLPKEYNLNKPLKHVLQKSTSPCIYYI